MPQAEQFLVKAIREHFGFGLLFCPAATLDAVHCGRQAGAILPVLAMDERPGFDFFNHTLKLTRIDRTKKQLLPANRLVVNRHAHGQGRRIARFVFRIELDRIRDAHRGQVFPSVRQRLTTSINAIIHHREIRNSIREPRRPAGWPPTIRMNMRRRGILMVLGMGPGYLVFPLLTTGDNVKNRGFICPKNIMPSAV